MAETMFQKSVIVASHPDDEILWFSSILDRVDKVVICYLGCGSKPHWAEGRKQSLTEHPIKDIICLGMEESEVFQGADWQNPVATKYGIEISNKKISIRKYNKNYHVLKKHLTDKLATFANVFTHNPWGEYGNEEHVQVYRVIKELQNKLNFNLWFSNYSSNSSLNLMLRHISGFNSEYLTLKTNKILGNQAMDIYKENNCWTWFDDWKWFNEESFMEDRLLTDGIKTYGHIFPVNMIKFQHHCANDRSKRAHVILNSWRKLKTKIKTIVNL